VSINKQSQVMDEKKIKRKKWLIKLLHWEYWSFNAVYMPIIWYWFYLALRARSFFFFNAANPSIKFGGFLMESKWDIYELLPKDCTPLTAIVLKTDDPGTVEKKVAAFNFPIICKPDMGSRGRGVAVIHSMQELVTYHSQCPLDYLLQEKINYPLEAGIFYVRLPGENKGMITGIVEKEFLTVTGDGMHTISELVLQNDRYLLQHKALHTIFGEHMNKVLAPGEKKLLVPFGNHARGCRFINSTSRANEKLANAIDTLCHRVEGFYYGRLDIRFESWEQLERLEAFSIIELNGSGSEPTHMYDPTQTIWQAWKEIITHWHWLYRVSKVNHEKGIAYLSYSASKKMFSDNKEIDQKMEGFTFVPSRKSLQVNTAG
jgi:hypothetical protein